MATNPEAAIRELMEGKKFRLSPTPLGLKITFEATFNRRLGRSGKAYVFEMENHLWKRKKVQLEAGIGSIRQNFPNFRISIMHMVPPGKLTNSVYWPNKAGTKFKTKTRVTEQGPYRVAVIISRTGKKNPE
ncbi:MAG: hypothetical protein ABIG96_06800 [Candidatus Micrarchaeota archaeon]